jgi:hypothetical protein
MFGVILRNNIFNCITDTLRLVTGSYQYGNFSSKACAIGIWSV